MVILKTVFSIIFLLAVVLFMSITFRKGLNDEISLAERKVKEYLCMLNLNIISFNSNQKEIKVKGFHVGVKIKATVVDVKGEKTELILIHNKVTDNITLISEKVILD